MPLPCRARQGAEQRAGWVRVSVHIRRAGGCEATPRYHGRESCARMKREPVHEVNRKEQRDRPVCALQ